MEKVSPCLCLHSGPTLQAILLQAVENGQLDEMSASVRNVNKIFLCVMLIKQSYCIGYSDIRWLFSPGSAEAYIG